ncbi:unannotated protein [freshwater metagenome]|uniref:Unannotated protein n=1 Tax=freshwater metagenome TaxID=449393 RepID=A0A6J7CSV4_9ZZZZ
MVVTPEKAPAMSGGKAMAASASTTDNSRNSIPIANTRAKSSPIVGMARETEPSPMTNSSPRPKCPIATPSGIATIAATTIARNVRPKCSEVRFHNP